ncbi:MAG: hypothetical protein PHE70_04955 [Tepidanaerobacteraceae bacterium]|nr:hypothetical protein [Tepidanaerobacteraceae bacterium]
MLNLRDFKAKAIDHLGQYKTKKLNITKKGLYNHKGKRIFHDHILPKNQEDLNIIKPYNLYLRVSEYLKDVKRHRYFHHLNSSQAMCINFFYPLIKEEKLDSILQVLHIPGHIDYSKVKFEKESHIETGRDRKTNFDFFIRTREGTNLYFEIKYTENEFGKVNNDAEHIEKFYRIYEPVLKNSDAISEDFKSMEQFFSNYQIMRNLIHIDDNSYVIFIYPKENIRIRKAALDAKDKTLKPDWKKHLIPYTWEDIIKDITQLLKSNSSLNKYYKRDFTEKYLKV